MSTLLPFTENPDLVSLVAESELFTRYRDAFLQTTGRSLRITHPSREDADDLTTRLKIPVKRDNMILGFLSLDSYRIADAGNDGFDELACRMLDAGATPRELRAARQTHDGLPAISSATAQAFETMLQIFAEQLGEYAEKIFLHVTGSEPATVIKARNYIESHLGDVLNLEEVAWKSGVSVCYFCKIFKRSTGMTFTEYVTRARVEEAKHQLLRPQARITEIAFAVGFQSLSQFNRSFKRLTTQSPTEFRSQRASSLTKSAA